MTGRVLFVALALPTGCAHQHLPDNAPGNIDVRRPPAELDRRVVEPPLDPGERMLVVSYGAFGGGGLALGGEQADSRAGYGLGPEVSLAVGENDRSHADDDFWVLPLSSLGANLGWTLVTGEGDDLGPLYAEFQLRETAVAFAAGWAWDADEGRHGPQGTLSLGPLYARATHLLDGSTQIHAGLVLKGWSSWVWSR